MVFFSLPPLGWVHKIPRSTHCRYCPYCELYSRGMCCHELNPGLHVCCITHTKVTFWFYNSFSLWVSFSVTKLSTRAWIKPEGWAVVVILTISNWCQGVIFQTLSFVWWVLGSCRGSQSPSFYNRSRIPETFAKCMYSGVVSEVYFFTFVDVSNFGYIMYTWKLN